MSKKTLIENAYIITSSKENKIIENGYILFDEENIIEVESGNINAKKLESDTKVYNAGGAVVTPGFINSHQHLAMSILRSGREATPNRLFTYFFPFEKQILNEDIVYNATRLSAWEMLTSGTTTAVDMYYFEDKVIDACIETNMRIVAGETIMTNSTPSQKNYKTALDFMSKVIDKYKGNNLVTPILAPHSPYMCDTDTLKEIYSFAEKNDLRLTMHASEFENELDLMEKLLGKRPRSPIDYLEEIGILSDRWHLAHLIFVDDSDIKKLAKHKVGIAHCPIANIKSGKGISPVLDMLENGLNVALATDGPLSGNRLDLSYAIGTAYYLQKLLKHNMTVLKPLEVFKMSTLGGAKAIGMADKIGSLEKGKYSDLILWRNDTPAMCAVQDEMANIVMASSARDINNVWVGGKLTVENSKLITTDTKDIITKCRFIQKEIKTKLENFDQN